jgi:hypothetical protein
MSLGRGAPRGVWLFDTVRNFRIDAGAPEANTA